MPTLKMLGTSLPDGRVPPAPPAKFDPAAPAGPPAVTTGGDDPVPPPLAAPPTPAPPTADEPEAAPAPPGRLPPAGLPRPLLELFAPCEPAPASSPEPRTATVEPHAVDASIMIAATIAPRPRCAVTAASPARHLPALRSRTVEPCLRPHACSSRRSGRTMVAGSGPAGQPRWPSGLPRRSVAAERGGWLAHPWASSAKSRGFAPLGASHGGCLARCSQYG